MSKLARLFSGPILTISVATVLISVVFGLLNLAGIGLGRAGGSLIGLLAFLAAYVIAAANNPYGTDNSIELPSFRLFDFDIFTNPREGIPRWIREQLQWVTILIVAAPFFIGVGYIYVYAKSVFGFSESMMNAFDLLVIVFSLWIGERLVCQYGQILFVDDHSPPVEN